MILNNKNIHSTHMLIHKPLFTVVIPVYNKGPHIKRSISSVLSQSFEDLELLIINDASTDNSLEEILKYSDPRIRVLHREQPGPGGYAARNLGIKKANSEWIAFLDADDEWFPDHLQKYSELIKKFPNNSVLGCGCEIYDPELNHPKNHNDPYYIKNHIRGDHILNFLEYLEVEVAGLRPLNGSTACIKKTIMENVNGFPAGKANRGGDVDTWLRCIEEAGGIAWGAHIGAIYHRDSVNMVTKSQLFLAEVERESVRKLLVKYSGREAKLLKEFANKRTISAWNQNLQFKDKQNFILHKNLIVDSNIIGNLIYELIKLLISQIFKMIHCSINSATKWIKKFVVSHRESPIIFSLLRGRTIILRNLIYREPQYIGKPKICTTQELSDGSNPTFFGYHDKTPFSGDGSKILATSLDVDDKKPENECSPMKIGYFSSSNSGKFENRFIQISQTNTWCWQQGCMLQWNPTNPNREIIFNSIVDGKYGSKLVDILGKETISEYPHPIYSISPSGKIAISLNFSRLGRLRPGYGYNLIPDSTKNILAPHDDGLFIFNLKNGKNRLLIDLAELAKSIGEQKSQHYINHATFSPDGKKIIFFHLWINDTSQGKGQRMCLFNLIDNSWKEIEAERIVSHYCWIDSNSILATTMQSGGEWHYSSYDLLENSRKDIYLPIKRDGHPMVNPMIDNIIVTDTYPDKRREQHLCLVNINSLEIFEVKTLYSPDQFYDIVRCDLHPRWDREGKKIAVDTVYKGMRCMLCIYLDNTKETIK